MIIFGWGRRTKRNIGPLGPYTCGVCNRTGYFKLIRVISWFSLFFIPVLPYSTKYLVVCPNCKNGTALDPVKVKELRELARQNRVASLGA